VWEVGLYFRNALKQKQRECAEDNLAEDEALEILSQMVHDEELRRPLKVGDMAPSFIVNEQSVSLNGLLADGPAVVTFYRGLWCPYCRNDLLCFEESLDKIQATKATVVGISHDLTLDRGHGFLKPWEVSFTILDDVTGDIAVQFGIRWPADELLVIQECLDTELGFFREAEPWIVPMQARFVIDIDQTIAFAEIAYNYDQRTSPLATLPILQKLVRARV
jgi:peroxiredoxin